MKPRARFRMNKILKAFVEWLERLALRKMKVTLQGTQLKDEKGESSSTSKGKDSKDRKKTSVDSLMTFNGNYADWHGWHQQFIAVVDQNNRLPVIIKLKRLVNSLEGPARAAVARYDFVAENYDRILQVLEMRYGQPHLVMLTFNRKMQAHKAVSELDAKGFLNFVDLATQYVKNMQRYAPGMDKYAFFPEVASRQRREKELNELGLPIQLSASVVFFRFF